MKIIYNSQRSLKLTSLLSRSSAPASSTNSTSDLLRLSTVHNTLSVIRMEFSRPNLLPQLRTVKWNFLSRPSKNHVRHIHDIALIVLLKSCSRELTNFFKSRVLWPVSNRCLNQSTPYFLKVKDISYLMIPGFDVHKASLLHSLLLQILVDNLKRAIQLPSAFNKELAPFVNSTILSDCSIVTFHSWWCFETLAPAAGFTRFVSFTEQGVPVTDASIHVTHVDVVKELGLKGPFLGTVFDFAGFVRVW